MIDAGVRPGTSPRMGTSLSDPAVGLYVGRTGVVALSVSEIVANGFGRRYGLYRFIGGTSGEVPGI